MHMLDMVGSPLSPIPLPADSSLGSPGFCQRESRPGTPLGSSRGPPSGPHWIRVANTQWAVCTGGGGVYGWWGLEMDVCIHVNVHVP